MEVGEQRRHKTELKAGRDEDFGRAGVGGELGGAGSLGFRRGRFEGANHRGADGHDAPAFANGAIDGLGRSCGQRVALAMQVDIGNTLDAQRRKRSQADVQRDTRDFYAAQR